MQGDQDARHQSQAEEAPSHAPRLGTVSRLMRRLASAVVAAWAAWAPDSGHAQPARPDDPTPQPEASQAAAESPDEGQTLPAPRPNRAHPKAVTSEAAAPPGPPLDSSHSSAELQPGPPGPVSAGLREPEPGGVSQTLRANPQPSVTVRYTLESIVVTGNTRTGSRVILRYVPFEVGDVIDVDDPEVSLTRYRLLGTGFFRDVQFSLQKGSRPGYVVLVIEVVERNTIIVNDLRMGLSADADTEGEARPLTAYAGLGVAETNLAGTGITLGSSLGLAQDQLALRVRFLDPAFLGSRWMTSVSLLYANAQDFFGNSNVLYQSPAIDSVPDFAVVDYQRFGGMLGVGRDLSVATQLWFYYRLESIDAQVPLAASHERGGEVEPIDFSVEPGTSVLSTLRGTLQYDSRDQPFLPGSGYLTSATAELALAPAGSDYDYQRIEVSASRWWTLPWGHVLRLEVFGGAITGNAPFFEQYYIGDFSDFLAGRVLQLNFDRRPPPNFLGTAIAEVRRGHYAAKVSGEYRIGLYRGTRSVFGIDFFTSAGAFAVASQHDLEHPVSNYSGAALFPVDLTANLGFRMDTSAGGFTFAFSNVLGFVPVRREAE
jgi:outer membrane protein insertion porin family